MKLRGQSTRSIKIVQEIRPVRQTSLLFADQMLDPLDAQGVALARRRSYLCAHCGAPVRIRVRSVASCQDTSGRRAHFAHAEGTGAGCPATSEACDTVGQVQAKRFNGKQEGARHLFLKTSLSSAIIFDSRFQSAACELSVRAANNALRRPDVLAISRHGPVAFDVQLSAPLIDTIYGRDTFYDPAWLPHAWIVDGNALKKLNLQGFQDLAAAQGGCILAWDEDCEVRTRRDQSLTMKVVKALDHGTGISAAFTFASGDCLTDLIGLHTSPPAMATDLHAQACFDAVTARNPSLLADLYNMRVAPEDRISPSEFMCSGMLPLLGALMTLSRGAVSDGSAHHPDAIGAVVNNALNLDRKDKRFRWALVIATAIGLPQAALSRPKLGPKTPNVIERALAATNKEELQALLHVWEPVLRRLFPSVASSLQLT